MNNQNNNSANEPGKGIDTWNERLDNNLEPEKAGDQLADINAGNYSAENGSGDQSDDPSNIGHNSKSEENEDNMAQNQPKDQDPKQPLSREE